jgi:hypothetical protein
MKIFNSIIKTFFLALMVFACQPEEIEVNTGPLFLTSAVAAGTDADTGEQVTIELEPNVTQIPVDAVFTINFSKAVDPASVSAVSLTTEDGTAVPASITLADKTITIDPTNALAFGSKYKINVTKDIKANDGGVFLEEMSTTFTSKPEVIDPFDGELFHMAFDGNFTESESGTNATVVGSPGFAGAGMSGDAYKGAAASYLTFPTAGLTGTSFSATFWMNINATPDRAGILTVSAPDAVNPGTPNNRNHGFRFFREAAGAKQRFKLNVGTGAGDSWFDGGVNADVDPATTDWVHFAFSISPTDAKVFINGNVVSSGTLSSPISWAGCDILSIMSGAPRFTEWGHLSDLSSMDELHLYGKALTQEDVQLIMQTEQGYQPMANEKLYMTFEGANTDLVSKTAATVVGSPGFAGQGVDGDDAYAGATDSYLTFPTAGIQGTSITATFWLNINATPDRAGILVASAPDLVNPSNPNNRNFGFRFFRENGAPGTQRFKLNVGNGTGETWVDGGVAADVNPATTDWVHFAFSISPTEAKVYINGDLVKTEAMTAPISWTGVDILSIMAGDPRFIEWGHRADLSYMDELRFFNTVLTEAEIENIMNN